MKKYFFYFWNKINFSWNNANNLISWFLESAKVYSSFILIQLICSMISMTCVVFQLDLVNINLYILNKLFKWNCSISIIKTFLYRISSKMAATQTCRFQCWTIGIVRFGWCGKSIFFLLLWEIGNTKFSGNVRCIVRIKLAWIARSITEIFHYHGW